MNTEGSLKLIHSLAMRRMRKMWDEKSLDALEANHKSNDE
jgi:hypothetical protein